MPHLDLDVAVLALGTAEAWGFWSSTSAPVRGQAPTRGGWHNGAAMMNSLWGFGDADVGPHLEICGSRKVE